MFFRGSTMVICCMAEHEKGANRQTLPAAPAASVCVGITGASLEAVLFGKTKYKP